MSWPLLCPGLGRSKKIVIQDVRPFGRVAARFRDSLFLGTTLDRTYARATAVRDEEVARQGVMTGIAREAMEKAEDGDDYAVYGFRFRIVGRFFLRRGSSVHWCAGSCAYPRIQLTPSRSVRSRFPITCAV